jgi:hypothetical protein
LTTKHECFADHSLWTTDLRNSCIDSQTRVCCHDGSNFWEFESFDKNSNYEGESNENRKIFFKFNLLNESGTQLYHFST